LHKLGFLVVSGARNIEVPSSTSIKSSTYPVLATLGKWKYSGITAERNVRTVDSVFAQDCLDFFWCEMREGDGVSHVYPAFVLLFESDVWWFFVKSDAETLEFGFYDLFMR